MQDESAVTTFLFTDIEGSTRLWEEEPVRMRSALERHDAIVRLAVTNHHGELVKMTGDGIHAAFHDPLDAIGATLELQQALADAATTDGIRLQVRCGMHAGTHQRRDDDFFGTAVNRAARIMSAAHGGQMLLSEAVRRMLDGRLPEGVGLRDLGSVRLRDLGSPERIFQLVHPALRSDFPALRSLEETPNNLPHEVTSFIGRKREIARVGELLAQGRLLTVIGMGGLGKTRLCLHVAAESMDAYPDGVWFVELGPLQDPRSVAQAVATTLAVKEEPGKSVIEALAAHVKDRSLLLVLDNCEHLTQACAELAKRLLGSGSDLKILASSREALRIAGETTFALSALAVPDLRAPFEPWALSRNEAVQLFIERAVASQSNFAVTEGNATTIAAICHRLDGIPLAIELAAARVRVMSVQQIAERLTDRFKLLKGGDPTTLPRQQTLRSLIDWSYDLLLAEERSLMRQLAVFAGGATLEAVEAICTSDGDVVELLGRLVDKSLVIHDRELERYRMLETVRHYARERLEDSGQRQAVSQRHLLFFGKFADQAKAGLIGNDQNRWLERIDTERENIISAHSYANEWPDGAASGLGLVNSLKRYWFGRGLLELGYRLTLEALVRPGARNRNLLECQALFGVGQLSYYMGRYAQAREHLAASLSIAREMGDRKAIAAVLQPLGMSALGQGDLGAARECLEEALELAAQQPDQRQLAGATNALAQLHRVEGRSELAAPLFEKALEIAQREGDRETVAIALLNLAMLEIDDSTIEQPREKLLAAIGASEEVYSGLVRQSVLEVSGALVASRGNFPLAARLFGAAVAYGEETGLRRDPADEAFLAPILARTAAALGSEGFAASKAAGRALRYEDALGEARRWLVTCR